MRPQLHLQRFHPRALQLGLEMGRPQVPRSIPLSVIEGSRHRDNAAVDENVVEQELHYRELEALGERDDRWNMSRCFSDHDSSKRLQEENERESRNVRRDA